LAQSPLSPNLRGIGCMVLAAATFVANDSFMKVVLVDAPPMQVLLMRGLAAALCCLGLLLALGLARDIARALHPWVLVRAACEVFAIFCFILALKHMPIGDVTAITQITPLLVLVGVALVWGETLGGARMVLIALGLTGALLVAQPGSAGASPFVVFGFLTALGTAMRDLAGRKVPHTIPGLVVAFATIVMVMLASGLAHAGFENWAAPTPAHAAMMLAAGFLLMCGHTFVFLAFRHGSAAAVTPFYYTFTIWAVLSGWLVFGEVPKLWAVVGTLLILSSGVASVLLDRRPAVTPLTQPAA
jgi:drug/metabolite transporter (DMT)-like permease